MRSPAAPPFLNFMTFRYHQEMNRVVAETLSEDSLIADIGSHDGYMARSMANAGHRVVCVDLDLEPLQVGSKENQVRSSESVNRLSFVCGDVLRLMFRKNSLDAVTSTAMLQVVHPDDIPSALGEMQRVTKPGGLNGLKAYAGSPEIVRAKPNYKIFEYGELRQFYETNGWEVIFEMEYQDPNDFRRNGNGSITSYSSIVARKPLPASRIIEDRERYLQWLERADPEACEYIQF